MKRRALTLATSILALLGLTTFAGEARAIERQHQIGVGPSFAMLKIEDKSTLSVGMGAAIHYTYGLSDQWNLIVEGSSAVVAANQHQDVPESPHYTRPARVDYGAVGIGYVIDILRWVPYVSLLGGLYHLDGGTLPQSLFLSGASIGVGLDYQFSRHVAIGVAVREHLLLTKLSTYPSYTTGVLRFEYMWGY